jgi:hypothetical protein
VKTRAAATRKEKSMHWLRIVIGTFFALLAAASITWASRRNTRLKKVKQLTYEELRTERDALFFCVILAAFWIGLAAPKVNWSFFGYSTSLIFSAFYVIVYFLAHWIIRKMDSPKSSAQGRAPNNAGV